MSVPRALLLVLALLQAFGVTELVRRATCEEACRQDGCDNDCTPGAESPSCVCHCPTAPAATAPAISVATLAPITPAAAHGFVRAEPFHVSPDPREIWHVPRLYLG